MKIIHILSKVLLHCRLTVGAFRPLEYHSRIFRLQRIHPDKRKPSQSARLNKLTVLQLSAHGHELFIYLLDPFLVKISGDF